MRNQFEGRAKMENPALRPALRRRYRSPRWRWSLLGRAVLGLLGRGVSGNRSHIGDLVCGLELLVVRIADDFLHVDGAALKVQRVVRQGEGGEPELSVNLFAPGGETRKQVLFAVLHFDLRNLLAFRLD